ncbi:hypothetical protein K438DRAFT_1928192 [Mycena galopus ATCC 62051]|nr:hypothetical protein K438DRAFT_1928192 [Mycena galopus ATCC 62051]
MPDYLSPHTSLSELESQQWQAILQGTRQIQMVAICQVQFGRLLALSPDCCALTKLGLTDKYDSEVVIEANGTLKLTEVLDEAFINVALCRPSIVTSPPVFGVMNSASDDAIFISPLPKTLPWLQSRLRGARRRDPQKYIFGGPVAEYMGSSEDKRFKKQLTSYLADHIGSEDIYLCAHAAIREDLVKPTDKSKHWKTRNANNRPKRLLYAECKQNIATKIEKFNAVTQVQQTMRTSTRRSLYIHGCANAAWIIPFAQGSGSTSRLVDTPLDLKQVLQLHHGRNRQPGSACPADSVGTAVQKPLILYDGANSGEVPDAFRMIEPVASLKVTGYAVKGQ